MQHIFGEQLTLRCVGLLTVTDNMEKFRIQTPIIIGGLASLANKEKCMYYAYFVCLLIRLQVVTLEFTMQPVMCVLHQKTDLGTAGPAAARPATMPTSTIQTLPFSSAQPLGSLTTRSL